MWALGYTGRGRIVYDYDTGVWPDHPAFSSRYMGNFFPTSQSWFPWASSEPNGVISDHGTHTLGTIAGLDTTPKIPLGLPLNLIGLQTTTLIRLLELYRQSLT